MTTAEVAAESAREITTVLDWFLEYSVFIFGVVAIIVTVAYGIRLWLPSKAFWAKKYPRQEDWETPDNSDNPPDQGS